MAIQEYCIGLKGAVNAIHRVTKALSGNVNSTTISDAVEEVAIAIENGGGGGGGGTTDHTKLQNRDSADQHPIGAITGLETELNGKANASSTYTKSEIDSSLATKQEKLQSGTNIKTINNTSLLGSGNIDIQGGGTNVQTQGDWMYKVYADGTFDAWYKATGQSLTITATSGNLYRSELQTLTLPTNLTDGKTVTIQTATPGVSHNNYPVWGILASIQGTEVRYYALSGGSRTASPNYIVTAHVFGTIK